MLQVRLKKFLLYFQSSILCLADKRPREASSLESTHRPTVRNSAIHANSANDVPLYMYFCKGVYALCVGCRGTVTIYTVTS